MNHTLLEWVVPTVFVPLLAVSLSQLVWTLRVVRRVRPWLNSERSSIELSPFASVSRWASAGWFIGVALAVVFLIEANFRHDEGMTVVCVVAALWSLLQLIVSWLSCDLCRLISRFGAMRQLGDQGMVEAAKLLPKGLGSVISEESLHCRVNTLGRVALAWLTFLSAWIVVGLLVGIAQVLSGFGSSAGQLLLLFVAFVVPGIVALYVMRCIVASRAQRAQFLWFLAATTQKQRPLASELMAWGRSHPSRYGAKVIEAARDVGVGDALSDALARQSDLLAPSDLMSVRVAEQTGTLAETLRDCAVRQTQSLKGDTLVANASSTGLWLWAVVIVAISIVAYVMVFIIPKFKAIFAGFNTEFPYVTVWMIAVSDMFVNWAFLWIPLFMATSCVFLWSCSEAFQLGWSETWLAWKLGFGREAEVPRLLRRLRGAVLAQMPWTVALQPMVLKHPQDDIRSRLERVLGRVTAGMDVWPAMRDSGLLTGRDIGLLEMAERANNLPWALSALAESKERSQRHRWQVLLTLLVPMFTLAAGFMVLMICVAFFMPLVKLLNDLS